MSSVIRRVVIAFLSLASSCALAETLPQSIAKQIPHSYQPIMVKMGDFNSDGANDYVVVAAMKTEKKAVEAGEPAPKRLLLAFVQDGPGSYALAGKNDDVVYPADGALQCDPFLDTGGIAAKGPYFTIENEAACGQHWTDFITFRYDKKLASFIFHKRISEVWVLNPSPKPDGDALVLRDRRVTSAKHIKPVSLNDYSPDWETAPARSGWAGL